MTDLPTIRMRGYKFRLSPTEDQAGHLARQAGACRFVYNLALEQRRDYWRPGRHFSFVQQAKELVLLRSEVPWLAEAHGHTLLQALIDLDRAFAGFFAGRTAFPRYHPPLRRPPASRRARHRRAAGGAAAVR